jgi:PKD repeat protein
MAQTKVPVFLTLAENEYMQRGGFMQSLKRLFFGLSVLSLATACQQSPGGDAASALNSATRCASSKAVDPYSLKVVGAATASAGQDISYSLSQDLSCSPTQKVVWDTTGAASQSLGSEVVSNYPAAGSYVVAAKVQTGTSSNEIIQKTVVVSDKPGISGPEIVTIGVSATFDLVLPNGYSLASAIWSWGDGSAAQSGLTHMDHVFKKLGLLSVHVTAVNSQGVASVATINVNVLDNFDGLECVVNTSLSTPLDAVVGVPVPVSAHIPACMAGAVKSIKWNFGDASPLASTASASHTYLAVGDYSITLQIFTPYAAGAFITLTRDIHVAEALPVPPPPDATPAPTPVPNPLACPTEGLTRESTVGDEYSQSAACGFEGKKNQIFKMKLIESCQIQHNVLLWTEVSRTPVLQSEGSCESQSCHLPNGDILKDGQGRTLYSSQTPDAQCSEVAQTRICANGILSGSENYSNMSCHNACTGFGPHGTVHTGVTTGEEQVALVCAFGEQGFFDVFNQLSDQTCADGAVIGSNTRRGSIKTPGACPVYSWAPSENWTACSADCGGQQNRIFECHNDKGEVAANERCESQVPVETRVCDGNPSAVAHVDRVSTQQEAGNSLACPANQIGVTVQDRTATNVKTYACVDHSVQLTSDTMEYTEWVTSSYCRNFVAYRCSNDSLSNSQAAGRYDWMLKCQDQVPVIKEFLTEFASVTKTSSSKEQTTKTPNAGANVIGTSTGNPTVFSISSARRLYPTFMDHALNPEKTWIAPVNKNANCTVPSTAYVAAVCVSSCATPEQEILAEAKANLKLKSVSFIEALTKNYGVVGTLSSRSSMASQDLQKTNVEQWVTELVDGDHEIREFHMRSGGSLRVTPNHPILSEDGSMKVASDFKVGDSLVKLGGQLDQIVAIDEVQHYGKVYNLFVQSADPKHNIVVTGGYLNGTAFFQNEGAVNLNKQILRNRLTQGIFSR